jgi:hypothetical protein
MGVRFHPTTSYHITFLIALVNRASYKISQADCFARSLHRELRVMRRDAILLAVRFRAGSTPTLYLITISRGNCASTTYQDIGAVSRTIRRVLKAGLPSELYTLICFNYKDEI